MCSIISSEKWTFVVFLICMDLKVCQFLCHPVPTCCVNYEARLMLNKFYNDTKHKSVKQQGNSHQYVQSRQ